MLSVPMVVFPKRGTSTRQLPPVACQPSRGRTHARGFPAIVTAVTDIILPGVSGGAIYHTALLRVANTTFVGNKAGVEGPAVMSVGLVHTLSNVSFLDNAYHCRAGEYGYFVTSEARSRAMPGTGVSFRFSVEITKLQQPYRPTSLSIDRCRQYICIDSVGS